LICLARLFFGGLPRSDTRVALETAECRAECRKWEGSDIADKPSVRGVVTLNMTTDIDIYRTANLLIEQHGEDAPIHATMQAEEQF